MRGIVILLLLSSACVFAGCRNTGAGGTGSTGGPAPDALVSELNAFTDELVSKVESARDTSAGVDEAQKLLESRRVALVARIAAAKKGTQQDAAARRKWLEAEVDNTDRVSRLQIKYLDASMRDPALKARLDKLVNDYGAIFKDQ